MKFIHYALMAILCACTLTACESSAYNEPLHDTKWTIAYKLVDGSWDTSSVIGSKSTKFWVAGSNGSYNLVYSSFPERIKQRTADNVWKSAVIDFDIVKEELVLDTTAKKVDLVEPDTLK